VRRDDDDDSLFTNPNDDGEFFVVHKPSIQFPLRAFVVLRFTGCRGFQRSKNVGHREPAIGHRLIERVVRELRPAGSKCRSNELECLRLGHDKRLGTGCVFVNFTSTVDDQCAGSSFGAPSTHRRQSRAKRGLCGRALFADLRLIFSSPSLKRLECAVTFDSRDERGRKRAAPIGFVPVLRGPPKEVAHSEQTGVKGPAPTAMAVESDVAASASFVIGIRSCPNLHLVLVRVHAEEEVNLLRFSVQGHRALARSTVEKKHDDLEEVGDRVARGVRRHNIECFLTE